jgi:hypothetical protein
MGCQGVAADPKAVDENARLPLLPEFQRPSAGGARLGIRAPKGSPERRRY